MSGVCPHLTCKWLPEGQCGFESSLDADASVFDITRSPGESDRELLHRSLSRARKDRTLLAALADARRAR